MNGFIYTRLTASRVPLVIVIIRAMWAIDLAACGQDKDNKVVLVISGSYYFLMNILFCYFLHRSYQGLRYIGYRVV